MRIVSKFRDYYDCMQGQGNYGSEPLYIRDKQEIKYDENYPLQTGRWLVFQDGPLLTTDLVTIGFCGHVYHAVTAYYKRTAPLFRAYSFLEFKEHIDTFNDDIKAVFYGKRRKWEDTMCDQMKKAFADLESKKAKDEKYFEGKLFPTFVGYPDDNAMCAIKRGTIVINERLSKLEFYKLFPPPQAFQEIQMYLSNLAWPNKPVPTVSNNDMIQSKGFDLKTSFRKEKQYGDK